MKKDIDIGLNKLYISKHNFKLIQNIMNTTGSINLSKILVKLDADKLRPLVETESYTNKNGEQVSKQVVKFELIPKKQENQKIVYSGNGYNMVDSHFASKPQTKEERLEKADTVFVGGGTSIVWEDSISINPLIDGGQIAEGVVEEPLPF